MRGTVKFAGFELLAGALSVLLLGACGGSSDGTGGGISACVGDVHGCTAVDYVDLTGGPASITFASGAVAYVPRCARVSAGQPITISGSFATHPISETCGPVNAIPTTQSGTTLTVTFANAGLYGYQCDVHHASGMEGAIQVVP